MKRIDKIAVAIVMLALAGCATDPKIHSPRVSSTPISTSETFAVIPVAVDPQLPHATAGAVAVAVESGTRDAVRALGYTETNLETADLVFYVHGKSMTPVPITNMDYVPAPSQFGMRADEMQAYAGRRIYVETYDNHTKRQIWMGWLECSCGDVNPEWISHEIHQIVATFPRRSAEAKSST
jgi:hypothetical protein